MSRGDFRQYIHENAALLPPPPVPPPTGGPGPGPPPLLPPLVPQPATLGGTMPEFRRASDIIVSQLKFPPMLVHGLLHRGCKMLLAGGSKSFKSWSLMDLAVSIAQGASWWGQQCEKGVVLYLNFEIIDAFFDKRLVDVCTAKGVALPENLLIWHLRAQCYDLNLLAKVLTARLAAIGKPIAAIIIDPIYKALGDLDENSASDMTQLMNMVESFALPSGAATVFGAHFAKGLASMKEAKDRPSGSGVFGRDPDCLITLTRHREDDCYTVETELRYLARMAPFVVRWSFPIMKLDEALDPRQLYQPGKNGEVKDEGSNPDQPRTFGDGDVLDCLPSQGAQDVLWRKMVALKFGRTGQEYYAAKGKLLAAGLVYKSGQKYYRRDVNLKTQ